MKEERYMNINICIDNAMQHEPDQVSIIFKDKSYTNRDIYEQINRMTNALLQLGCTSGSHIGYLAKNRPECIVIFYAAARIGAVFTSFDYTETSANLIRMADIVRPEIMFADKECIPLLNTIRRSMTYTHTFISLGHKYVSLLHYDDLIAHASDKYLIMPTEDTAPAAILFTSGTTSERKAVAFSHINFIHHVFNTNAAAIRTKGLTSMLLIPTYHILGFQAFTTSFYFCHKLVILPQFEAGLCLKTLESRKISQLIMPPSALAAILMHPDFASTDLCALKNIQYGGDQAGSALITEAISRFPKHVDLRNLYGLTETTFDIAALTKEDHDLDCDEDEKIQKIIRLNSIGRALKQVTIIIADGDGNELNRGEIGEVLIHSERSMIGYVSPDTHEIIPYDKYWIHSGDIGYMDDDGYIFLMGQMLQTLPNQKGLRSPELSASFITYPYMNAQDDDTLDIYNADLFRLRQIINQNTYIKFSLFLKNLHKQMTLSELTAYYLDQITHFIPSSAFGLHILPRDMTELLPYSDTATPKWNMAYFDIIPLYATNSNVSPDMQNSLQLMVSQCRSLQEYIEVIKPNYLICTPLFNQYHHQVALLSFSRLGSNWPFSNYEQALIRIISSHMCIAITNVLEHDALTQKNMLLENIIQVTGIPAIVTTETGDVIYENQFAHALLERELNSDSKSSILGSIIKNIALIRETHEPNFCRRVHTQFTDHSGIYNVQTATSDFLPPTYISVINKNSDAPDFNYLDYILSEREIEIVTLIAQGFNNTDISQLLHISINTIKYHLKNIFRKLDVSTRTELLTKAYSLKIEISPVTD